MKSNISFNSFDEVRTVYDVLEGREANLLEHWMPQSQLLHVNQLLSSALVSNGRLKTLHGKSQFPTGLFDRLKLVRARWVCLVRKSLIVQRLPHLIALIELLFNVVQAILLIVMRLVSFEVRNSDRNVLLLLLLPLRDLSDYARGALIRLENMLTGVDTSSSLVV